MYAPGVWYAIIMFNLIQLVYAIKLRPVHSCLSTIYIATTYALTMWFLELYVQSSSEQPNYKLIICNSSLN